MTEKTSAAISMKERKGLGKNILGGCMLASCVFFAGKHQVEEARAWSKNVFFACQTDECRRNPLAMALLRCFSL